MSGAQLSPDELHALRRQVPARIRWIQTGSTLSFTMSLVRCCRAQHGHGNKWRCDSLSSPVEIQTT